MTLDWHTVWIYELSTAVASNVVCSHQCYYSAMHVQLIEGLTGEKDIYRRRTDLDPDVSRALFPQVV